MKTLILIGGSSGAGKTTLARQLQRELECGWIQADIIWQALLVALPPESSEGRALRIGDAIIGMMATAEELVEWHTEAARVVQEPLAAAIAFELANTHDTLIVDGAWLLPEWMTRIDHFKASGEIDRRAVVLFEEQRDGVREALRSRRKSGASTLPFHALSEEVAWRYGLMMRDGAVRQGIPVVEALPREGLAVRARTALGLST